MQKSGIFGVLAQFDSPAELMHAAEKARDKGFKKWDVYSPFPIHGMDKAMGLGDSHLGWIVLVCALIGVGGGFLLQWWVNVVAYPLIIAGKPFNSYPAWVPVTFELGILLSGFGAVFGMLALNGLPRWYHAFFRSRNFAKVSDDGFFLGIEATDSGFDLEATPKWLGEIGGKNIEVVEDEP